MIDMFQLYDQAILTWLNDNLSSLLVGRTTQMLIATPRRGFAEVFSGRLVDNNTLTLPRISITRLDHANDPERYCKTRVRRLGWCDDDAKKRLISAKFPSPVTIPYQIDLWTRFVSEMNLWEQKFLTEFDAQYIYITIRPDDVWQDKSHATHLDGGIVDNSDLEPDEGERAIRKTVNLRMEGRLYDQSWVLTPVVKAFEAQWRNSETEDLYYRAYFPPLDVLAVGDGNQKVFNVNTLRTPISESTLLINTVIGGSGDLTTDDGNGNLSGPNASGTVDYTTGAISLTYTTAPDDTEDITATYFTSV